MRCSMACCRGHAQRLAHPGNVACSIFPHWLDASIAGARAGWLNRTAVGIAQRHRRTTPAGGWRPAQRFSSPWTLLRAQHRWRTGYGEKLRSPDRATACGSKPKPLRSPPKEERDLLAQAASNRCVALDNLSSLPAWLSDALCRLATGGGHSARTLYTDLEEISLAAKRPVVLNGIEDVATRPDLAERVLQIERETIPDHKRISQRNLWQKFDEHDRRSLLRY